MELRSLERRASAIQVYERVTYRSQFTAWFPLESIFFLLHLEHCLLQLGPGLLLAGCNELFHGARRACGD